MYRKKLLKLAFLYLWICLEIGDFMEGCRP